MSLPSCSSTQAGVAAQIVLQRILAANYASRSKHVVADMKCCVRTEAPDRDIVVDNLLIRRDFFRSTRFVFAPYNRVLYDVGLAPVTYQRKNEKY